MKNTSAGIYIFPLRQHSISQLSLTVFCWETVKRKRVMAQVKYRISTQKHRGKDTSFRK